MVHTFTYGYSAIHVLLKLHDFMVLVPFPKGKGVSSVPYTAHLVPCLEGGDVLLISSPLGLPFVAIFCSLDVQLLRILPPWWSWCSHMYVK